MAAFVLTGGHSANPNDDKPALQPPPIQALTALLSHRPMKTAPLPSRRSAVAEPPVAGHSRTAPLRRRHYVGLFWVVFQLEDVDRRYWRLTGGRKRPKKVIIGGAWTARATPSGGSDGYAFFPFFLGLVRWWSARATKALHFPPSPRPQRRGGGESGDWLGGRLLKSSPPPSQCIRTER